ncbi:MAG TPA: hypothetical protein VD970_12610 [Acetobacteraceae bacterium]|nr:hypothetical protein [Acetobacteraceae bacterium]
MTQPATTWLLALGALLGVLALLVLLARLARATGLAPAAGARRLVLAESLPLDARRRAVLIRCDGREVLLLVGGAQDLVLGWLPPSADRDAA